MNDVLKFIAQMITIYIVGMITIPVLAPLDLLGTAKLALLFYICFWVSKQFDKL